MINNLAHANYSEGSSGSGVTSVSASGGLSSTGGATPNITIPGPIDHDLGVTGGIFFNHSSETVQIFGQQLVGSTGVQWIPNGGIAFKYNATGGAGDRNFMLANGNFGLGNSPSYKLDVVGSSRFNGNIGFFNTTPISQITGGAATAGGAYGATEQIMLQTAYDALRSYGLLS